MSSFKDTFTRDQRKEPLLNYDGNAAQYFGATLLLFVVIPWTYHLIKKLLLPPPPLIQPPQEPHLKLKLCTCQECTNKTSLIQRKHQSITSRFNKSALFQLMVLIPLWAIFLQLVHTLLQADATIQNFDPFHILNIARGATEKEIKKAYRTLSLQWHPDKNPNNAHAEHMFMLISKAQLALTDEVAKRNYEKYGNPDGPSSMKIGIGLPPFLVEEGYELIVLVVFFLFILLVVPLVFISYFQKQRRIAASGVNVETLHLSATMLNRSVGVEDLVHFVTTSAESRAIAFDLESEKTTLQDILKKMPAATQANKFSHPAVKRHYILLMAHCYRLHHMMTPKMKEDLKTLIEIAFKVLQSTLEICCVRGLHIPAISCVNLKMMLSQAIGFKDDQLLQLPHFDRATCDAVMKGKNAVKCLNDYCLCPDEEKKGLSEMTEEQKNDVLACCRHVSDLEIFVEAETKGEKEICANDIVTFTVNVIRRNLKENEVAGPIHAPYVESPIYEKLHVFLFDNKDEKSDSSILLAYATIKNLGKKEECALVVPIKNPGKQQFKVFVMSDAYRGIDRHTSVEINVLKPDDADRKVFVHEEDLALDKQPTLFEQMMGLDTKNNDSDDEEEVVDS